MSELNETQFVGRRAEDPKKLYPTDTLKIKTETPILDVGHIITRAKTLSGRYLEDVKFDQGEVRCKEFPARIFWVELAKGIARTEGILRTTMDPVEGETADAVSSKTDLFKLALVNTDAILTARSRERQLLGELYTDSLTGLPNRKYVEDILSSRIQEESAKGKKFTLLRLDIDTFKEYNDQMSHEYGDEAIKAVGEILYLATRSSDLAIRMSGDEFVIVLEDIDDESAIIVSNRIQGLIQKDTRLNKPRDKQVTNLPGSVSIGIAPSTSIEGVVTFAELDRRADAAAYASKKNGRAKTTVYQEGMETPPKVVEPPIDYQI